MTSRLAALSLRLSVVMAFAFIFAPIVVSFVFSLNAQRFPTLPLSEFTLDWYRRVWSTPEVAAAFQRSLIIAAAVSVISTFIGFSAAYTDYRFRFTGKLVYLAIGLMPPTIPVLILGLAMLVFLGSLELTGSIHSVVISHVVLCTPFAMAVTRLRLAQMDANLEAAAWNLGASQWRAMWHVVLPFSTPAILAALFVTAAISFDEFTIAWFVAGVEETLPVRVLNIVERQASPAVNAIGSVTFTITMALVILAQVLMLARPPRTATAQHRAGDRDVG